MNRALDAAFVKPVGAALKAVSIDLFVAYTGEGKPPPSRAQIDDWIANGVGFLFVGEGGATDSLNGYAGGVAAAQSDNAAMDSVGYPGQCVIARAMSDQSALVPGEAEIPVMAEYARAYGDYTRAPGWIAYGNTFAIRAARLGSPKCIGGWIPTPWDIDNGSYLMMQEANYVSPIPDTDLDTIVRPFPWWGAAMMSQGDDMATLMRDHDTAAYWSVGATTKAYIPNTDILNALVLAGHFQNVKPGYVGDPGFDAFSDTLACFQTVPLAVVPTVDVDLLVQACRGVIVHGTKTNCGLNADAVEQVVRSASRV